MSLADEADEARSVADLKPGDTAPVENQDGGHNRAIVAVIRDEPAGECQVTPQRRDAPISIKQLWRPVSIGADEPVVGVRFVKGVDWDGTPLTWTQRIADYPASRVMQVNFGGADR
ncbi:MAG: hypothetical protein U5K70_04300 [Halodesulfurarchaeum sp.]|nr:hypothetical protein [Halodesulfurarchaeum sp.]